jgi:hypothetical protein
MGKNSKLTHYLLWRTLAALGSQSYNAARFLG